MTLVVEDRKPVLKMVCLFIYLIILMFIILFCKSSLIGSIDIQLLVIKWIIVKSFHQNSIYVVFLFVFIDAYI